MGKSNFSFKIFIMEGGKIRTRDPKPCSAVVGLLSRFSLLLTCVVCIYSVEDRNFIHFSTTEG